LEYVDIVRHFRDLHDEPLPPATRRVLRGLTKPVTWERLLSSPSKHLVLVAASGTGKTTEMENQARRLRGEGRYAVFRTARTIAEFGLDGGGLDSAEDRATLAGWRRGDDRCVVFVDGIDELVLDRRDFRTLVRRLVPVLDPEADNWQLVLSARTGGWSGQLFRLLLGLLLGEERAEQIREVTFEPLSLDAVRALAKDAGCSHLPAFMEAFRDSEVDATVDLRPKDIAPLVAGWNRDGTIPAWESILEGFQDAALAEADPDRDIERQLTVEEGRLGARRIGAATILMKKSFVALPARDQAPETINGRLLFADWRWQPLSELFQSPLFVQKGREVVQLPAGPLPSYLAARWLAQRWRGGKDTRWLRDQLLVRVHGDMRWLIPQSRREAAGWLGSRVPEFRAHLAEDFPHVVLFEGDPDRLRDKEILDALEGVLEQIRSEGVDHWPTRGTLRKLARPGLEEPVVALLDSESDEASQKHLMRWCVLGEYGSAVATALRIAQDAGAPAVLRGRAIETVAACGQPSQRSALLGLLSCKEEHVRAALILALVPDLLSGQVLVDFLADGGEDRFLYTLGEQVSAVGTGDLDALIERLLPSIETACQTADTNRQLGTAVVALAERARRPGPYSAALVQALHGIERRATAAHNDPSTSAQDEIDDILAHNTDLRRQLWRLRFEVDASGDPRQSNRAVSRAMLGHQCGDDLLWIYDLVQEYPAADEWSAWQAIIRAYSTLGKDQREQLLADKSMPEDLLGRLRENETRAQEAAKQQHLRREERRKKEDEKRAENAAALVGIRAEIAAGDNGRALAWGNRSGM
jgi:hypothetical protein